jgi:hypothetical protein
MDIGIGRHRHHAQHRHAVGGKLIGFGHVRTEIIDGCEA